MQNYKHSDEYISLNTPLAFALPKSISVGGETLLLKDSFHMSIHCIKDTRGAYPEISTQEVQDHFDNFVSKNPIHLKNLKPELRYCTQGEKRTIVVMVESENINEYFLDLNKTFNINVPTQPTHITLYTLQPNKGIGLTSPKDLDEKTTIIRNEILEEALEL